MRVERRRRRAGHPRRPREAIFEKFTRGARESASRRRRPRPGDLQGDRRGARRHDRAPQTRAGGGARWSASRCRSARAPALDASEADEAATPRATPQPRRAMAEPRPSCCWSRTIATSGASCAPRSRPKAGASSRPTRCAQGLADAATRQARLSIVDLGLPDGDGVDLIRELRSLVARCRSSSSRPAPTKRDKVRALDAGADDYIEKPFGVAELLARVRANLRRQQSLRGGDAASTVVASATSRSTCAARIVTQGRRRGPPDADRIPAARRAARQRRPRAHASPAAARGVGPGAGRAQPLPARLHGQRCATSSRTTRRSRRCCSPRPASAIGWSSA